MNKVVGLGLAVVLVGGAIFFTMSGGDTVSEESNYESFLGSIADLQKLGDTIVCTFENITPDVNMTGIVYMDGEDKMRMESTIESEQFGDMKSYTIIKDDYSYMWSTSMGEKGMKMLVPEESVDADTDTDEVADVLEGEDMIDQENTYSCEKWKADSKMFELPEEIVFEDFDAMMGGLTEQAMDMEDMALDMEAQISEIDLGGFGCDACNMIPDETAKAECLVASGC